MKKIVVRDQFWCQMCFASPKFVKELSKLVRSMRLIAYGQRRVDSRADSKWNKLNQSSEYRLVFISSHERDVIVS